SRYGPSAESLCRRLRNRWPSANGPGFRCAGRRDGRVCPPARGVAEAALGATVERALAALPERQHGIGGPGVCVGTWSMAHIRLESDPRSFLSESVSVVR